MWDEYKIYKLKDSQVVVENTTNPLTLKKHKTQLNKEDESDITSHSSLDSKPQNLKKVYSSQYSQEMNWEQVYIVADKWSGTLKYTNKKKCK